jgi:hypothetical protein
MKIILHQKDYFQKNNQFNLNGFPSATEIPGTILHA